MAPLCRSVLVRVRRWSESRVGAPNHNCERRCVEYRPDPQGLASTILSRIIAAISGLGNAFDDVDRSPNGMPVKRGYATGWIRHLTMTSSRLSPGNGRRSRTLRMTPGNPACGRPYGLWDGFMRDSGRLTSSNAGTCVLPNQDSSVAPQTLHDAWPVCGTKNFVSVRLYSAPQSHWTIVAIHGICAFGEPVQAGLFAAIKGDLLAGLGCSTSLERQTAGWWRTSRRRQKAERIAKGV
jgi:hypothetical protein